MNKYLYSNNLKTNLVSAENRAYRIILCSDCAQTLKEWICYNVLKIFKTLPKSPKIKPIKHLWKKRDLPN